MKITMVLNKIDVDNTILDYIERRFTFVFGRTRYAIQKATVTLSDVNEPKGAADKQCRILIQPEGLPKIVVTEQQRSLQAAIDRCLARVNQSLTRSLAKKRDLLRDEQFRVTQTPLDLQGQMISGLESKH